MRLMQFQIDDIIKTALLEDINYIDVTTDLLVSDDAVSTAKYVSKDEGVLCGIEVALRVFKLLDDRVSFRIFIHDGEVVQKGDIIAEITGPTRALLKGERTALNLVQHMSGIATATNKCVQLIAALRQAWLTLERLSRVSGLYRSMQLPWAEERITAIISATALC